MQWRLSFSHGLTISTYAATGLLLAACGGGGGDPATRSPANAPAAGTINSANAVSVVGDASEALMHVHMLGGVTSGLVTCGTTGSCTGSTRIMAYSGVQDAVTQVASVTQDPLSALAAMQAPVGALVSLPVTTCTDGGTISGDLNDVNNDGKASTGDTLTFTFNACSQRGAVRNGTVTVSNFTLTGTPNVPGTAWSFTGTVAFQNYAATRNDGTTTTTGSLEVNWSSNGTMMDQGSLSTNQLTMVHAGQSMTFSNVSMTLAMDSTAQETSMVMNGQVNVAGVGAMTITTPTPMKAKLGQMVPFAGSMTVTLSASSVTVNTTTAPAVELRIDTNKDGTVDNVVASTWDAIHGMDMPMPGGGSNTTMPRT